MGFFSRLKEGLSKTRKSITERIDQVLVSFGKVDEELFEELEEVLVTADLGVETVMKIMDDTRKRSGKRKITDPPEIKNLLRGPLVRILGEETQKLYRSFSCRYNGDRREWRRKDDFMKKIAHALKNQGKKVMLAAADTFRAAAIDQIEVWASRVGVDIISHQEGSDPAAVVYDAIQAARARKADVLICDTAGRLHTKKNLMEELRKVSRIIDREMPGARRENLLVLDATTGQNAVSQAKTFSEVTDITGIVLTKLDGTAKGGIVLAIKVRTWSACKADWGREQMDDLQPFNAKEFVEALFS